MPNARTATIATPSMKIGGCWAAREISQAAVPSSPIPQASVPTAASTATLSHAQAGFA